MRAGIVVHVTRADRHRLEAIVSDRSAPEKHVWRAKIILATADGCGTTEISADPARPARWYGDGESGSCWRASMACCETRRGTPDSHAALHQSHPLFWTPHDGQAFFPNYAVCRAAIATFVRSRGIAKPAGGRLEQLLDMSHATWLGREVDVGMVNRAVRLLLATHSRRSGSIRRGPAGTSRPTAT